MKRIVSLLLVVLMVVSFAACGSKEPTYTPQEVDKMVDSGDMGSIIAYYSVRNEIEKKGFYVQFNSALENFDYYAPDGTLVKFDGREVVYDKEGNEVDIESIEYGQALLIAFDGEAYDTDPATIKAYKVTLSD